MSDFWRQVRSLADSAETLIRLGLNPEFLDKRDGDTETLEAEEVEEIEEDELEDDEEEEAEEEPSRIRFNGAVYNFEPPNGLVGARVQNVLQHMPVYMCEWIDGEWRLPIPPDRFTYHELYMREQLNAGNFCKN